MYENRKQRPLHRGAFVRRMALHGAAVGMLLVVSLALGMAGYMHYENLPLDDAFLNTAMLLGGMGPVDAPHTVAGKLFAGLFALYAGLLFLIGAAVLFTPLLHRLLHKFHWIEDES